MDMALRSLIRMSPVPVRTTEEIETDAVYNPKDKIIEIRSDLSDAESFAAQQGVRQAMIYLQQFRRETDETDYANKNYMRMGIPGMALDIGIDGIVPDIYAQGRINSLRKRVKEAIRRLETIMKSVGIDTGKI